MEDVLIPKNRMTLAEMAIRKKQIDRISLAIGEAQAAAAAGKLDESTRLHKIAKGLCDRAG